jgi:membrane associated rhomboid family serine protease
MAPSSRKSRPQGDAAEAAPGRPWLTGLLALACVVGFATQMSAQRSAERDLASQLDSAGEFLLERPYLSAPALLEQHLGAERLADARGQFERSRLRRAAPPIPDGVRRRHQGELDRRVEQARSLLAEVPARRWGLAAGRPTPEALVGHPFVHLGWLHLLAVLVPLGLLGVPLEAALGTVAVAFVAIVSAAGAGVAFVHMNGGEGAYLGMTGLLAGLWGAWLVRERGGAARGGPALVTGLALLVLPAAVGLELAVNRPEGLQPPSPGTWVASNWALLGGLAGGVLASLALRVLGVPGARGPRRNRALERARALAGKRPQQAYEALVAILRRDPEAHEAAIALWGVAVQLGRTEAAAPALLRAIRDEVERGRLDSAVSHWLDLVACDLDTRAEPGQLLRMATLLRDAGEPQASLRALRAALDRAAGAAVASRIAREAALLDPRTAEEAAWRALGSLELDLEERQSLETLLGELQPRLAARLAPREPRPRRPAPAARAAAASGSAAIEFDERARPLECAVGVPVGFDSDGVHVELENGSKKRVRFDRIEAVAVASVEGLTAQPVILVDLVLNWMSLTAEPLRLIRLRCDRFDPRRLVAAKVDPLDAVRALVKRLLQRSDATPLPDLQSASGMPFAAFESLAAYQRSVLMVETEAE